ncbi:SIR2 family protein [Chryseobacterium sp. 09-1422]|uniref:SIR2 family protein n=1 Tax=Chryseobacterium kimseyorum TaxID=2984028 RepID=A0ABT3HYT3_9FLAO|nr:SIR2 family protein [Chryseobacterium kimseyorum]MCW3168818.1 SIR2 family protein [Chryseobacterium kimseyorum]
MSSAVKKFIKEYSEELIAGKAAYFIGAGISVNSNLPSWTELIKPFAKKIGIKDIIGKDMTLMAQYVINEEFGNKGPFLDSISRKFRRRYFPNPYHYAISKTNITTIWTTNYDNLLEEVFANVATDIKFTDESISRDVPDNKVEIIKMHGCIYNSHRSDITITQSDYEDFFEKKPAIVQRLRMDLLQKSFLFIGYGYNDSNIQNIITEARRLSGNNTRQHYLITTDKKSREFDLWCLNLRRYGIRVIRINKNEDLLPILESLSLHSRGRSVFITGSHNTFSSKNAKKLSKKLARIPETIFNDGQSSGLMRIASNAFMETIIDNKDDVTKRFRFFPNPYSANPKFANDVSLLPTLKEWRIPLFKSTYVVIAFDGGMGTKAEVEIALDMGCIVIPFFSDKKSETWQLLKNKLLIERIEKHDKKYIKNLRKEIIKYNDLLRIIKNILR